MWVLAALLTGSALAAALSVWSSIRAARAQDACAHAEARLLAMRGRVIGVAEGLESLAAQHRKLAGRVYADQYWNGQREEQPQLAPSMPTGDVCQNWLDAKRDGPGSRASKCECGYCSSARAVREQFRQQAVPKSARAQNELAKLNGSNDG